jgi:gamma-glutamyltranspeptidase
MLIRMADGRSTFIDFRERAPGKSTRDMYLDAQGNLTHDSIEGWRSAGVPGSVRGFEMANTKYGRRTWAENMAPAIELATKGYAVSYPLSEGLRESRSLARDAESKRIFQRDGRFFDVGETLVQPDLGRTLQRIAANGSNEFYEGETAKRLAEEMAKHGGLITLADLKDYKANRTHAAPGRLQRLHRTYGSALEFRRHCPARNARHPGRHRIRKGGGRLGIGDPLRGRSHAPRVRRSQRVPRRSRLREEPDQRPAR